MKQSKRKVSKRKVSKRKVSKKKNIYKKRINNKTRRFRKQYGGKLNEEQILLIKHQIQELGFTDAQKEELIDYLNKISQPLSQQSHPKINPRTGYINTLLDDFFKIIEQNYTSDSTPEEKKEIFLDRFRDIYHRYSDAESKTDHEDLVDDDD
jgi:hypothetical protein